MPSLPTRRAAAPGETPLLDGRSPAQGRSSNLSADRNLRAEERFTPADSEGRWGWLLLALTALSVVIWWQPWSAHAPVANSPRTVPGSAPAEQTVQINPRTVPPKSGQAGEGLQIRAGRSAPGGPVTRCSINGVTTFSDTVCDGVAGATVVDVGTMNVAEATRQTEGPLTRHDERLSSESQQAQPDCPSALDIRNLETRLSGRMPAPSNAQSVRLELVKARSCTTLGLRYEKTEWARLRAALRGEE